jgi:hypothetical protein
MKPVDEREDNYYWKNNKLYVIRRSEYKNTLDGANKKFDLMLKKYNEMHDMSQGQFSMKNDYMWYVDHSDYLYVVGFVFFP